MKIQAEKAAQEVWAKFGNGSIPVNVEAVARNAGLNVMYQDRPDGTSKGRIIGCLRECSDGLWCSVKGDEVHTRRRYVLARLIGEYVLFGSRKACVAEEDLNAQDLCERNQALNIFASCLLMPTEKIHLAVQMPANAGLTVQTVADAFEVSLFAISYRLKNLGYALNGKGMR